MGFTKSDLDILAQGYTSAWNSKDPRALAAFRLPTRSIIINRGESSIGLQGLKEMTAGIHVDVPDLQLVCG